MPDFAFEFPFEGPVIGVDEAGRGPWAGPVVAGAVSFDISSTPSSLLTLLNDSKKLSSKRREEAYERLVECPAVRWGVGISSVEEIDDLNILKATYLAMERAVQGVGLYAEALLIDGNRCPPGFTPRLGKAALPIIKGDSLSYSIAAASIMAKVTRDRLMVTLAQEFPGYGWEKNAGYGTKDHQEGLKTLGVTPHHRRSYAPIRALLEAA